MQTYNERKIIKFGQWLIEYKWTAFTLSLMLLAVLGSGAKNLSFDNNYKSFFGKTNPQLVAFEEIQNTYIRNDNILFALEAREGNIYDPDFLAAVSAMTDFAWRELPYAIRVDSLATFQHTEAFEDDLKVQELYADAELLSSEQLAKIRSIAEAEPYLINQIVRADARLTGVNVTFEMPQKDPLSEVPETVAAARALAEKIKAEHPSVKAVYLTGVVMINNAFAEAAQHDVQTLIPAMVLFILVLVGICLRTLTSMAVTLVMMVASIVTTFGVSGYLGVVLTSPTMQVPIMVMTLAVADTIHVLYSMGNVMRQGMPKREAIVESLRVNFGPIFITSVTTAIGFLSLNFNDSPPLRDVGNMTAIGVIAAWIYSVTLLPAMLAFLPYKVKPVTQLLNTPMSRFADFVVRRRQLLLLGMGAFVLLMASGVPRNISDDRFIRFFDETITFRTDTSYVNDNLAGIYTMSFSMNSGIEGGVADPEFLRKVDRFTDWLKSQPEVTNVQTITDIFKRLNKNLHGDDPSFYRLPDNDELAAQYLLLYEMSLPFGLDLGNQLDINKQSTRLIVVTEDISSKQTREFTARASDWLNANMPELHADGVGPSVMFSNISKRSFDSMISGTIVALIGVSLLLILALRSFKFGLLSLIPNIAPMLIAFGVWGFVVVKMSFTMSVVMGMTLGIVVDDTVHFLSKYLRARREKGMTAQDSVRYAFNTVGGALVIMTIALLGGFLLLSQSAFYGNSSPAALTSIAIAAALIADFLLLPPLILFFDKDKKSEESA